jgi:sugar/nucleoside kinase (ribokinase family)
MSSASRFVEPVARAFDVICAGEALWSVDDAEPRSGGPPRVRPGGGAVSSALALARQGLRVGLATVLENDSFGRHLKEKLGAAGIDTGGVELAHPTSGIVFVRGGARQVVSLREQEQPVAVPSHWSSQVLLLSGMSPVVSHGAALCMAARAARRAGSIVVVDVNARWELWAGRDPRAIRMILREADVVWASAEDLFGLNMDAAAMRAAMRPTAVLASSDGAGSAFATGAFGEVVRSPAQQPLSPTGEGDAFATAICAELARAGKVSAENEELWARALRRGHEAATALDARMARR